MILKFLHCAYFIIHWQVTSLYSFPHFWCSSSWRHCWCWKGRGHSSCSRPWTWGRRGYWISIRSWPLGRSATRLCWTSILQKRNFMTLVIDKTKLNLTTKKVYYSNKEYSAKDLNCPLFWSKNVQIFGLFTFRSLYILFRFFQGTSSSSQLDCDFNDDCLESTEVAVFDLSFLPPSDEDFCNEKSYKIDQDEKISCTASWVQSDIWFFDVLLNVKA